MLLLVSAMTVNTTTTATTVTDTTITDHYNRQPQEGFAAQYQRGLTGGGYKAGYYSHGLTVLGGDGEDVTAVTADVVNRTEKTQNGSAEDLPCLKEAVTLVKSGSAHMVRVLACSSYSCRHVLCQTAVRNDRVHGRVLCTVLQCADTAGSKCSSCACSLYQRELSM